MALDHEPVLCDKNTCAILQSMQSVWLSSTELKLGAAVKPALLFHLTRLCFVRVVSVEASRSTSKFVRPVTAWNISPFVTWWARLTLKLKRRLLLLRYGLQVAWFCSVLQTVVSVFHKFRLVYSSPAQHTARDSFAFNPRELFLIVENAAKARPRISACPVISSFLQRNLHIEMQ